MKKILLPALLCFVLLVCGESSFAQVRYGITGGATFSSSRIKEMNRGTMAGYHAGLALKVGLPLGFSVQPSLLYHVKGAKMQNVAPGNDRFDVRMSFLELPVSFQWGPDLLVFRPFLDVTPYIGYGLSNKLSGADAASVETVDRNAWGHSGIRRFEYGLGTGVGIEVWRLQVTARYNWNFGPLSKKEPGASQDDLAGLVANAFGEKNFGGFTVSLSLFFGGK